MVEQAKSFLPSILTLCSRLADIPLGEWLRLMVSVLFLCIFVCSEPSEEQKRVQGVLVVLKRAVYKGRETIETCPIAIYSTLKLFSL